VTRHVVPHVVIQPVNLDAHHVLMKAIAAHGGARGLREQSNCRPAVRDDSRQVVPLDAVFSPDTSTPNVRTPAIRRFRSRLSSEWSMRTPTPGALLIVKRVTRCPPPPCSQTATPQLFT